MKWIKNIAGARIPIKSWCATLEAQALQQAINLAHHPATQFHVALMPDCHVGYGMPIGGVIATQDVLIPNAVGVDIGCGMIALEIGLPAETFRTLSSRERFMTGVRQRIPLGEGRRHGSAQAWRGFQEFQEQHPAAAKLWPNLLDRQNLGSLGGGNHFIELQTSDEGELWLMIHSGSRNLGQRVARHYHAEAMAHNRKMGITLPDDELAFLPLDTRAGAAYLRDMNFALAYAHENRQRMLRCCQEILHEIHPDISFLREINIHHNYAAAERHFGRDLFVHRKGATSARKDQLGIIPGSMGTASYIVRGLGNPESFASCSHGAGRVMGRNEANRRLSEDQCNRAMRGIAFGGWGQARRRGGKRGGADLSEAPQAYKDIDEVIQAQSDLIVPVVRLQPLAVVKG